MTSVELPNPFTMTGIAWGNPTHGVSIEMTLGLVLLVTENGVLLAAELSRTPTWPLVPELGTTMSPGNADHVCVTIVR